MRHQEYLPHEDSDEEDNKLKLAVSHSHKPYGNLVMLRTATPHISLGPDCTLVPTQSGASSQLSWPSESLPSSS